MIDLFVRNDEFHKEICPGVWLMDNHKWAFWVWTNYFTKNSTEKPAILLHFDHHWDAVNDFNTDAAISTLCQDNRSEMYRLVAENYIRKDGFIAPAIIKGYFNEIHFYCKQANPQIGFSSEFLNSFTAKQCFYDEIEKINDIIIERSYAFDLDIDLFNNSEVYLKSKLWPENQRDDFFDRCELLIKHASIVTIAMSYGYSGTKKDTKWLTQYTYEHKIRLDV